MQRRLSIDRGFASSAGLPPKVSESITLVLCDLVRRRRSANLENRWNESLMAGRFRNPYEKLYWSLNPRQLNG
jgi:hypothetical protein